MPFGSTRNNKGARNPFFGKHHTEVIWESEMKDEEAVINKIRQFVEIKQKEGENGFIIGNI